jgi:hypothetical protein
MREGTARGFVWSGVGSGMARAVEDCGRDPYWVEGRKAAGCFEYRVSSVDMGRSEKR